MNTFGELKGVSYNYLENTPSSLKNSQWVISHLLNMCNLPGSIVGAVGI